MCSWDGLISFGDEWKFGVPLTLIFTAGEPFCLADAGEDEDPGLLLSFILMGGWFFARSASFALR